MTGPSTSASPATSHASHAAPNHAISPCLAAPIENAMAGAVDARKAQGRLSVLSYRVAQLRSNTNGFLLPELLLPLGTAVLASAKGEVIVVPKCLVMMR